MENNESHWKTLKIYNYKDVQRGKSTKHVTFQTSATMTEEIPLEINSFPEVE